MPRGLFRRFRTRTHHDKHAVGIGSAAILERAVAAAGKFAELPHAVRDHVGCFQVPGICRLAGLEKDVGVLGRTADHRAVRRQRTRAMVADKLVADHGPNRLLRQRLDLRDFVRGPEAVEEVQYRHPAFERRAMRDQGKILRFLHRVRGQHREACGTAGHDVAVIAENRQGMSRYRARSNVKDRRRQLAGDLEHVGNHEQQALRGRKGRRQRAALQRAVHRAGGTALALHFDNLRNRAPQVRPPCRGPGIGVLAHR